MKELLAIICVCILLTLSMGIAAWLRHRAWIGPEIARKAVHVILGVTVASFPWVFTTLWPVWFLATTAALALWMVRMLPRLRQQLGGALHDVERKSWGEIFFPVAAAVAWTLAPGDPIRFSLPILVLTFADTMAAIAGKRWGQRGFTASGARKTLVGFLAFVATTSAVIAGPLLIFSDLPTHTAILVALDMALVLMLVEGLSWEGCDNLFLPIAGVFLLYHWLAMPLPRLIECSIALALITMLCWWWRRRTTLDDAAIFTCAVFFYVLWSGGGWDWILPPAGMFLVYAKLFPPESPQRDHPAILPLYIAIPILIWLVISRQTPDPVRWSLAAAVATATHLMAIGLLMPRHPSHFVPQLLLTWAAWLWSLAIIMLPLVIFLGKPAIRPALLLSLGVLVIGILFFWWQKRWHIERTSDRRWLGQTLASIAVDSGNSGRRFPEILAGERWVSEVTRAERKGRCVRVGLVIFGYLVGL